MGILIFIAIIYALSCLDNALNRGDTFTTTCDKCGSRNVSITAYGLKCHNCGAERKN